MSTVADVVIVGGGVAGLTAGLTLITQGYTVIVLEAQNRFGGRVKTDTAIFPDNFPVDLGAQWIHGHKKNPITDLLNEMPEVPEHFKTDYDNCAYFDNGTESTNVIETSYNYFETVADKIADMQDDTPQDMPLGDAIDRVYAAKQFSPDEARYSNFWAVDEWELEYAASADHLSMWWFDTDWEYGGNDWWLKDGYSQVPDFLATGLDIRFGSSVSHISTSNDDLVYITTTAGDTFQSSHVVVTVPLGILKKGNITFSPGLPSALSRAIEKLYMGILDKGFLQFDEVFWTDDVDFFYALSGGITRYDLSLHVEYFNINYYLPGSNILCVFEGADAAYNIEQTLSSAERVESIMTHLRAIWPLAPDPSAYFFTNWGIDPFTFGSYSSYGLDSSPADREAFLADTGSGGKLFFAGEHTSMCYPSTVHGAYWSGLDAARRVMGQTNEAHCSVSESDDAWLSDEWIVAFIIIGVVSVGGVLFFAGLLVRRRYFSKIDQAVPPGSVPQSQ